MTDILKNTASGMVAAAALGYQVGVDLRDRLNERDAQRSLREWQSYAQQLEQELGQTKAKLAIANDRVTHRDEAIEEIGEMAKEYAARAAVAEHKLTEKDAEVRELRATQKQMHVEQERLKAEHGKLHALKTAQAKRLDFLNEQVEKLRNAGEHSSAQAAAYDALFKLLVDEIARQSVVDERSSLSPAALQKVFQDAYLGFRRTKKVLYIADEIVAEVGAKLNPPPP